MLIFVRHETLGPIVDKYVQKFSPVQWCLLATEALDMMLLAALSDMMAEIVQMLTTDLLRTLNPLLHAILNQKAPAAYLHHALENLNIFQGESILRIFADALEIQKMQCEHAEQLTELVEKEVSKKIFSISSTIINCSAWPQDPAFYVIGSISTVGSLHLMVGCAARCLRDLALESLSCRGKPHQRRSYKMSVPRATEALTTILVECCKKIAEDGKHGLPPDIDLRAQNAVPGIVRDICTSLCCVSGASRPHFDRRSVFKKVRKFIERNIAVQQEVDKGRYSRVIQRLFAKMLLKLRVEFKEKGSKFLVNLEGKQQDPGSPQPTRETLWPTVIRVLARESSEDLAAQVVQKLVKVNSSEQATVFLKSLTYRIYHHLFDPIFTGSIKNTRMLGCVLLSEVDKLSGLAVEVMYKKVEDALQKFLQQVFICMKNKLFVTSNFNEALSGVMADIEDLVTNMVHVEESASREAGAPGGGLREKCAFLFVPAVSLRWAGLRGKEEPLNIWKNEDPIVSLSKKTYKKMRAMKRSADVDAVSRRLSYWLENRISIPQSPGTKVLAKAVVQDLLHRFCSPDVLWEADSASSGAAFDDAVLQILFRQVKPPEHERRRGKARRLYSLAKKVLSPASLVKRLSPSKDVPSAPNLDCVKVFSFAEL